MENAELGILGSGWVGRSRKVGRQYLRDLLTSQFWIMWGIFACSNQFSFFQFVYHYCTSRLGSAISAASSISIQYSYSVLQRRDSIILASSNFGSKLQRSWYESPTRWTFESALPCITENRSLSLLPMSHASGSEYSSEILWQRTVFIVDGCC